MNNRCIFSGTRTDLVGFLKFFTETSYFPGFGSHCPSFNLIPDSMSVGEETTYIKFEFRTDWNTCIPVTVFATKMPDNRTLLVGKVFDPRHRGLMNMEDKGVSYAWDYLVERLQEYDWLSAVDSDRTIAKSAEGTVQAGESPKFNQTYLTNLRQLLVKHFDQGELKTFCIDLGVDYDNLGHEGKENKARELVSFMDRRGRIPELASELKKQRPTILFTSEHL